MRTFPVLNPIRSRFAAKGFDILHPFATSSVPRGHLRNSDDTDRLGLIVGSTKNIWTPFVKSLGSLDHVPLNPFDDYVTHEIEQLTQTLNLPVSDILYPQETDPDRRISFQTLGALTNLSHYAKELGLCVHEEYGVWFAFRACIILDSPPTSIGLNSSDPLPLPLSFPCTKETQKVAAAHTQQLVAGESNDWLKLRDTVVVGADWRYEYEQLMYHYGDAEQRHHVVKQYLRNGGT